MSRDVFISYKTEDKQAADRLCAALESKGVTCWLAPRDIPPGAQWASAIVEGIQHSSSFVLLLSQHSVQAKQISREAELADKQNIPIYTFRLEDVQPPKELLYFLGNLQWLDAFAGQFDTAAARLSEIIQSGADYPAPKSTFQRPSPPPPPVVEPATLPRSTNKIFPWALGGLMLGVVALAWFVLHTAQNPLPPSADAHNHTQTTTPDLQSARAFADQLIKDRESRNYEADWNAHTESFRASTNHKTWLEQLQKRATENGPLLKNDFRSCQPVGESHAVECVYYLQYQNGPRYREEIFLAQSAAGWQVERSVHKQEP